MQVNQPVYAFQQYVFCIRQNIVLYSTYQIIAQWIILSRSCEQICTKWHSGANTWYIQHTVPQNSGFRGRCKLTVIDLACELVIVLYLPVYTNLL